MTLPKSEPTGAESALLNNLVKGKHSVEANTHPLWNAKKHDTSTASSFAQDLKGYNCPNCNNGTCPACKLRRRLDMENPVEPSSKGGPGSGYFGPHGAEGGAPDWGGSGPRQAGAPNLDKVATGRVSFQKNRLAREIVAHAARIKQIEETPFRGPKLRYEAHRQSKELRKKIKELGMKEDDVWNTVAKFPPQEQALLAQTAKLQKDNSLQAKIVRNAGNWLYREGLRRLGTKFAPPKDIGPEEVRKLSLTETAAYLAAYASDPADAHRFIDALRQFDITKAKQLQQKGFLDARSNTLSEERNLTKIDAYNTVRQKVLANMRRNRNYRVTQREVDAMVADELNRRSKAALAAHRAKPSLIRSGPREPIIHSFGFGGKA